MERVSAVTRDCHELVQACFFTDGNMRPDIMSADCPGRTCHAIQSFPVGFPGDAVVAVDLVVHKDALNHC